MKSTGIVFVCLLAVVPCAAGVITAHDYHLGESLWRADDGGQATEDGQHGESRITNLEAQAANCELQSYSGYTIAWNPKPTDGAELVATNAKLSWLPGDYAVTHKVYFGTDFNDVNEGNPVAYKVNQIQTTYDPGILEFSRTYYWRIDEVNDTNTWRGDVWGFTVWDGPLPCPAGDLVEDCRIDLEDLRVFMEQWLDEGGCSEPNCADLNDDLVVDFNDFAVLAAGWRYKMIIAAHRGSSYTAPENTLAAFNLAWQQDADAAELDVHLSKDNRVMVIHDETTGRTAWNHIDLRVKDTNSAELRNLDVGRWKGEQFADQNIPFLEEVIETVPPWKKLFVEIKCGPEILPYVKQIFENSGKKNQMVVIGFNFWTLFSSKQLMPDVPTYWLVSGITDEQEKAFWVQFAGSYGLDGLDAHYGMVTDIFIRTVRSAGQGLYTWTVNDFNTANSLKELGVDGITTDRPDWLLEHLE